MDEGKTLDFFKSVPTAFNKHSFVMKADDDVYLHLPNIHKKLQTFPNSKGVYFGRAAGQFMAGMGYILSWDLAQWIATDAFPSEHPNGQEDALLAWWLTFSRRVSHWESDTTEALYDAPESLKEWAHPYTPNTLLIHQLKNTSWFLNAAAHFMGFPAHQGDSLLLSPALPRRGATF
jgi:hypothetical protein